VPPPAAHLPRSLHELLRQLLDTAAHLPSRPGELVQQLLEESMVLVLLLLNQWSDIRSSIRVCIQSVICIWRSVCKARFSNTPGVNKLWKNLQYQTTSTTSPDNNRSCYFIVSVKVQGRCCNTSLIASNYSASYLYQLAVAIHA
jgi:hypothetical protein